MNEITSDIAFTNTVKAIQTRKGSRKGYERMAVKRGWQQVVDERLSAFIASRESFYLATTNAEGQPYVQHRGGPRGFLKVLDEDTLAFADFIGNKQYITQGNLQDNPKAFIFLMDYTTRQRIKIWGRARVVEDDPALLARVVDDGYGAKPEQVIVFEIDAWDVNCPQHIPLLFSAEDVAQVVAPLEQRIAELEATLKELGAAPKG